MIGRLIAVVALCAGMSSFVHAQDQRGLFTAASVGFSFAEAPTPGIRANQPVFKGAGMFRPLQPFESIERRPDYSHLFSGSVIRPRPRIDALSSLNDVLPISPEGVVMTQRRFWAALLYSVTPGSRGAWNSHIRTRATEEPGPGAEVMGFYVPGTDVLPLPMPGHVFLEHSALDFHETPPADVDIAGLDVFMPWLAQGGSVLQDPLLRNDRFVAFSLSSASANRLWNNEKFFTPEKTGRRELFGSTVLFVEWDYEVEEWSQPAVLLRHEDLGLSVDHDIDALAVLDYAVTAQGTTFSVIFSTVRGSGYGLAMPSELMFMSSALEEPLPVRWTPPGSSSPTNLFPEGLRLHGSDDINSLCTGDPERTEISAWAGTPTLTQGRAARRGYMGLALGRSHDPGPNEVIARVSGWARRRPSDGLVYLFPAGSPGQTIAVMPRSATDDVVEFLLPMRGIPGTGGLYSVNAMFVPWDPGRRTLVSWDCTIRL